ncbi:MAG TPA: hypothetical protein VIM61_05775 [Chthoniobacterales bacterium]|jgi:hypothetical protein
MRLALKILAVLFVILAGAAIYEGVLKVHAYRETQFAGRELTQVQFLSLARNLGFTWLFAAMYAAIGAGLWQQRKFTFILVLLFATLVGQWMNVGYRNGFVLSFVALAVLAAPKVRASFRN